MLILVDNRTENRLFHFLHPLSIFELCAVLQYLLKIYSTGDVSIAINGGFTDSRRGILTISDYIFMSGLIYVLISVLLIFKHEKIQPLNIDFNDDNEALTPAAVYRRIWGLLKLPNMRKLIFVLLGNRVCQFVGVSSSSGWIDYFPLIYAPSCLQVTPTRLRGDISDKFLRGDGRHVVHEQDYST